MAHKLSEVNVNRDELLQPNYHAADLVGKILTITEITFADGQNGEYMVCKITGYGLDPDKRFSTGAQNIMAKVRAAASQGLLPLEVTVKKLSGNAFDIE